MDTIKIINPILRGFHPDPCICRAKGKYYLITSTFEWLPGVALYDSDDLARWISKGGILKDLNLAGIPDRAGIWAPALSYDQGTFYLIYTICKQIDGYFKDVENYVVTAPSIEGPWSRPIFVNASGFDPSMYHEDGKHYILNPQWDPRPLDGHRKFNGLILQEFDMEKGMIGESTVIYHGSGWGNAEGPHIMKKDHYYYILSAEGGTGRHHSVCVARSENLWGPYEISPYTPMITAWEQDTVLKRSGHGNLVETEDGEWYLVHLCGRYLREKDVCVLGRETALEKVRWTDGWPQLYDGTCVPQLEVELPVHREYPIKRPSGYQIDFRQIGIQSAEAVQTLEDQEWLSLRNRMEEKIRTTAEGLYIKGGASLTSTFSQSLIARRLENVDTEVTAALRFRPYHYAQTAGLACYYNTKAFYYLYVGYEEEMGQRVLSILKNDNFTFTELLEGKYRYVPENAEDIYLRFCMKQQELRFFYSFDGNHYEQIGKTQDSSILSDEHVQGWAYTGTVAGITAVDTFNKDTGAIFLMFEQKEKL